ncbi:HD domain-containing protein [Pseudoalteromonas ruthenica]|uniref:HD domain-containing protein n=1 Tax=Pseudoalteromonas ruthenica TaxID=151081 RepID=UPI00241EAABE|nr:TraI domain-containing protein [Pseudoalteromonas ruthenica]|tara:strand:- start:26678 stop:27607 length:930 start_codon:yes stop_codon:yes gene_type:complete
MRDLKIDSLQPLLIDVPNYQRFMGHYYLSELVVRTDSCGQTCWVLTLSDGSGDFRVYCNSPDMMATPLQEHTMIHVEAALQQTHGSAYYKCKNLLPNSGNGYMGCDLSVLPRTLCPFPEIYDALIIFVSRLSHPLLQRFIRRVLLQTNVGPRFLQCPASLNYHHNYPGGLLQHSVEIAWAIVGIQDFSPLERDIAVVSALLHDIGKTLTLTPQMTRTAIGRLVDHSQLTLELCAEPLRELEASSPSIAHQLRHAWTCYSPRARYGYKPKTAVAKHLQRVDKMNADQEITNWHVPVFDNAVDVLRNKDAG